MGTVRHDWLVHVEMLDIKTKRREVRYKFVVELAVSLHLCGFGLLDFEVLLFLLAFAIPLVLLRKLVVLHI